MSLADYYDGVYLAAGWHKVRITDLELFQYPKTQTDGVKFYLETAEGSKGKATFTLKYDSRGCMARLASFAKACGLTKEECGRYEPERASSHSALMRKAVQVLSELDENGKYHDIVSWRPIDAPELPNAPAQAPAASPATPTEVPAETFVPTGDEIPF